MKPGKKHLRKGPQSGLNCFKAKKTYCYYLNGILFLLNSLAVSVKILPLLIVLSKKMYNDNVNICIQKQATLVKML